MKRIVIILAGFLLLTLSTLAGVAQATPPSGAPIREDAPPPPSCNP